MANELTQQATDVVEHVMTNPKTVVAITAVTANIGIAGMIGLFNTVVGAIVLMLSGTVSVIMIRKLLRELEILNRNDREKSGRRSTDQEQEKCQVTQQKSEQQKRK